jgi:signal transduction histidine kinase
MKYANELFFIALSLIMWGLVFGSKYLIPVKKIFKPEGFWYLALILEAASFTFFAIAPAIQIKLLTLANTCLIGGYIYLATYCRSLSQPISRQFKWGVLLALLPIALIFEYLMQRGTFVQRVGFVMALTDLAIIWQLMELKRLHQLRIELPIFLIFTMVGELICVTTRLIILVYIDPPSFIHLYDEPTLTAAVRWILFSLTTLSYIAIICYSLRKITVENTQTTRENQKITELLKEKERLIYGLLKANKTVATGALSASIAHELNQPLGASLLNIQFLKMLHKSGKLTPELTDQLLNQLEEDANRSGNIIWSLKSIFTKDTSDYQTFSVNEVLVLALDIYKSELINKGIQVTSRVDKEIFVTASKGQLLQISINLMNNAIQALSESGTPNKKIQVNCLQQDKNCIVEIIDNGPGISEDRQKSLFELLNTDRSKGMGLGLWLCSQIMNNFGGKILYEDASIGGAKFILTLPITPPQRF